MSDIPRTEEGMQATLRRLADARTAADDERVGQALLDLAFLVKWVRSDNDQAPFERSHTLALEALSVFQGLGDAKGQISALLLAAPFETPESSARMLDEADGLASALGDDLQSGRVLAARSRQMALRDRKQAKSMALEAYERFRRVGHTTGMAGCKFSLSILPGTPEEQRAHALEASALYRDAGDRSEASRALALAMWNTEEPEVLITMEPEVRQALAEAQEDGDRSSEERCYGFLARIAEARGDAEEAAKNLRWQAALAESDGLSPLERWKESVESAKELVAMAKRMGSKEMVVSFQEELRRLKKEKP